MGYKIIFPATQRTGRGIPPVTIRALPAGVPREKLTKPDGESIII
jgi:hypothetical protein